MKISLDQYLPADVLTFEDDESKTIWQLEFNEMDTRTTRNQAVVKLRALADLMESSGGFTPKRL